MPTRRRASKPDRHVAAGRRRVSVKIHGSEKDDVQEQEVQVFEVEPAYVRVSAGVTRNLGNYESLRVDVAISVPCYQETIDETIEAVAEGVSSYLEEEVQNYIGDVDGKA